MQMHCNMTTKAEGNYLLHFEWIASRKGAAIVALPPQERLNKGLTVL